MPTTYSDLLKTLDNGIYNKSGSITNLRTLVNKAVLKVVNLFDLRGLKKTSAIPYAVHEDIYNYAAPSDMKGSAIITIRKQADPQDTQPYSKYSQEEFDRLKSSEDRILAIASNANVKRLLINKENDESSATIDDCNSITDIVASDNASNLALDTDNYIESTGSAKFTMAIGAGTGILTFSPTALDLTAYQDESNFYIWAYIPDATYITNYILRFGNDTSNYFETTVTQKADGTAFTSGWNLLKFTWLGATETGTVDLTLMDYFTVTITTATGFLEATNFRLDNLIVSKGVMYETEYYSRYAWKNTTGTSLEKSTANSDYLELEEDEIALIEEQIIENAAKVVKERQVKIDAHKEFIRLGKVYELNNPSERMFEISNYI